MAEATAPADSFDVGGWHFEIFAQEVVRRRRPTPREALRLLVRGRRFWTVESRRPGWRIEVDGRLLAHASVTLNGGVAWERAVARTPRELALRLTGLWVDEED